MSDIRRFEPALSAGRVPQRTPTLVLGSPLLDTGTVNVRFMLAKFVAAPALCSTGTDVEGTPGPPAAGRRTHP